MINQIDDLIIPSTLSGNVEPFNADIQRRTTGGRLITKASAFEKWRATLNYESRSVPLEFQHALYAKCREMRLVAKPVTFISGTDGQTYTVNMKCTQPLPPKIAMQRQGTPLFYTNVGAVFEEV